MELQIQNGDYVPDGLGGFRRLTGGEALLQRVLFRLVPRRGAFPFMPELGSRLYLVLREKPAARQALAEQYVADRGLLTVRLDWQGEALAVQTLL